MTETALISQLHDAMVIGAGAAGVGVAVTLHHAGVNDFYVLDRDTVGASFERWPAETRFITPSFPTNSIGMLDLNSVALGTSPAITLGAEHPTGAQYAEYLFRLAKFFELPICANTDVQSVQKVDDEFHIEVAEGTVRAKHLIWAAGEFQYPRLDGVAGAQHCVHTATVERYDDLEGNQFVIIGGYESGIDAAYHLAKRGKHVRLFDSGCPWRSESSDPSVALSTFSQERMSDRDFTKYVTLEPYTKIAAVQTSDDGFTVSTLDGVQFETDVAAVRRWVPWQPPDGRPPLRDARGRISAPQRRRRVDDHSGPFPVWSRRPTWQPVVLLHLQIPTAFRGCRKESRYGAQPPRRRP